MSRPPAAAAVLAALVATTANASPFPWTGEDLTRPIEEVATLTVTGDPGGRAGYALAVTDWDGDGALDLVVAEPWADVTVPGEGLRVGAGRIGVFLAPFAWRTDGAPAWSPRTVSMDDADVLIRGPAGARLGYRLLSRPAGADGPALAASLPDLCGGRDGTVPGGRAAKVHVGEVWLLDGGGGAVGSVDATEVLWERGRLWWEGESEDGAAWVPNDVGYELATLDDLDGDGLPELAIAVASVVVYTGDLPIELQAGGTLIVPGRRVLDGDLGSVSEGWFLTGNAGQQEPVFTGASYLPRLTAHGPDGFLIGELMHHRGAGAVVRVPAAAVAAPPRPLTISASGWVDGPGLSPRIELDDGLLSIVGEGTAVGGEFTFGSAATALDGAPFLAIAALQATGADTPPRAATELVPRARLDELEGTLAETDDLDPWRILGDEHPSPEWLDEAALETDLGRVAQHIEASSGWWTVLLAACLLLSPEYGDHQCLADFAGLFQFAPTAMASYPRSAHVPAGFAEGLVIGEPLFDGGRGALHAVLPDWTQAPGGAIELAPLATPPQGWMVSRLDGEPGSWLGHSVAMPGDMDGDGIDDLVVGAPGVPADQDALPGAAHLLLSRLHADHDGDGLGVAGGDCDDGDPDSHPGATERCDGADNDCDGIVPLDEHDEDDDGHMPCGGDCDDADPERYPADVDGDGYGPCDGDCDDGDPALDPGDHDGDGYSTCDGDCDDSDPDRDLGDLDGDGWSTCGAVRDCDDQDAAIHPDADEAGDGVDNDCDGLVDEGVPTAMGCGWSDAGRSADLMRPGAFLALGLALSLRIRPRRRDPAGRRRSRSTPTG